ncbi:hypothetical protein [Arthrobacter sp. L77]|uniref:hypothetical protein n=1 Tax=Arthrobacter sp. L77 TaxID=1496689 RepID=UPI00068D4ACA|nr:hypothetical protein [Arthrobacter sp. L77]
MNATTIQWAALGLCSAGAAVRIPGLREGRGRTMFVALVLLTIAVGLSIEPIYLAVDAALGGVNIANLLLRLALYAVFLLFGIRMAAAFGSTRARRLIVGPFGLSIVALTVAATLYFFVASELAGSSTGLHAFGEQDTVQQYAAVGRLYPGYVAACLVIPAALSAFDRHARIVHRFACALVACGNALVVVFVLLRLTTVDLMYWDILLPFSAILLTVLGLCLIWVSHTVGRKSAGSANKLA